MATNTATTGRRITTEEATIKTATVEIKALTIGGKQVTLAVFRQLIEEPIIDYETGQLRGVPWGMVNYHSGTGCRDYWTNAYGGREISLGEDHHLHIVWQKGNELRRACVPANYHITGCTSYERAAYESTYEALAALDQLFIAV